MHEVQTDSLVGVLPDRPASARTVWMFGFQRRRVRRWEWLTDMPKPGPLPQTSQVAATVELLRSVAVLALERAPRSRHGAGRPDERSSTAGRQPASLAAR